MLNYRVEFQFDNLNWTDVTPDVARAEWRFGQLQPNQVGTVLRPADGVISLHNQDGKYTAYNPATGINPNPGVLVRISSVVSGANREVVTELFNGWSEGFHTLVPLTENYITEVPIVGPLYRFNTYNLGIFRRVTNQLSTGAILTLALQELGYTGGTDISANRTKLYEWKLNADAVLGSRDARANLLEVCKTLAQAEMGRIYDNWAGTIVFEGREIRRNAPADYRKLYSIGLTEDPPIVDIKMERIGNSIINSVKSRVNKYRSSGVQDVPFLNADTSEFNVSPNQTLTVRYEINASQIDHFAFVQSWEPLRQGTHYTYKEADGTLIDGEVFLIPEGEFVSIAFVNNTEETRKASVLKLEGDVWKDERAFEVHIQAEHSVNQYGLKEVTIPLGLIVDPTLERKETEDHLNWVVNTHDGMSNRFSRTPNVDLMRQIVLTYKVNDGFSPYLRPEISDIFEVTSPRMGLNKTRFWVDAVDYKIDNQGSLVIKLGLTDARYTSMWSVDKMVFEENTKPGF